MGPIGFCFSTSQRFYYVLVMRILETFQYKILSKLAGHGKSYDCMVQSTVLLERWDSYFNYFLKTASKVLQHY